MTRHIALGNQELLVNIDEWLQVRDVFFPHVGQYNHVQGRANKVAVIVDGTVSWINDDTWERDVGYREDTLLTESTAVNTELGVKIEFVENVYCEDNIFFRQLTVKNLDEFEKDITLAFTQDFCLYGDGVGETAYYNPRYDAVTHYKDQAYFLNGIIDEAGNSRVDSYSIGSSVSPSELDENPIAQGDVESMITTDISLSPGEDVERTYYMCAGETVDEVESLQGQFCGAGAETHITHADMCQRGWVEANDVNCEMFEEDLTAFFQRSLLIIKTQFDSDGAILAANDSDNLRYNRDTYSYMWPRDGALVTTALIEAGYPHMTEDFFTFCEDVIYHEGCLLHKYNPNKTLGSSWHPWIEDGEYSLPIQEDETALVLHALQRYYEETKQAAFINERKDDLIKPMAEFLLEWRQDNGLPRPSYDLWEERRGTYTFTTASVIAGLSAAANLLNVVGEEDLSNSCHTAAENMKQAMTEELYNDEDGYFRRGLTADGDLDETLDASAYATFAFDVLEADDERVRNTMEKVNDWLHVDTDIGGIARYYNDHYRQVTDDIDSVPGNPWFICTLWHAQWVIDEADTINDLRRAKEHLRWVMDNALSTGVLPEQVHPYSEDGVSVSPLTWSHAEFVRTVAQYSKKYEELI